MVRPVYSTRPTAPGNATRPQTTMSNFTAVRIPAIRVSAATSFRPFSVIRPITPTPNNSPHQDRLDIPIANISPTGNTSAVEVPAYNLPPSIHRRMSARAGSTVSTAETVSSTLVLDDANPPPNNDGSRTSSLFKWIFGSRTNSTSVFSRRNSASSSNPVPHFTHTGSLSSIMARAADELVPHRRPVLVEGREPGTLTPEGSHQWLENAHRAKHIRNTALPPARREFNGERPAVFAAASAAAMHRALELEWENGEVLVRSIRIRGLDVNRDDAQGVVDYFAVTDAFVRAYFTGSDVVLGHTGREERQELRSRALEALELFSKARKALLEYQGMDNVHDFIGTAEVAQLCTLAVTKAEACGRGMLVHADLRDIATEISMAPGGTFLVLMLARGAAGTQRRVNRWAKQVLFPSGWRRAIGMCCVRRLMKQFYLLHGAHVHVFSKAEVEYRAKFDMRGPAASTAEARRRAASAASQETVQSKVSRTTIETSN